MKMAENRMYLLPCKNHTVKKLPLSWWSGIVDIRPSEKKQLDMNFGSLEMATQLVHAKVPRFDLTLHMTEIPERNSNQTIGPCDGLEWFGYLKCIEVLGCIDGSH